MTCHNCLLSLKSNRRFFLFLQSSTIFLIFSTVVLCFVAFQRAPEVDIQSFQRGLQIIGFIMIIMTVSLIILIVWTHITLRGYQGQTVNVWGELVLETTRRMRKMAGKGMSYIRKRKEPIIGNCSGEQAKEQNTTALTKMRLQASVIGNMAIGTDNGALKSPLPESNVILVKENTMQG